MGSLTRPHSRRLKAALSPEFELIQPLILLLLVAYVDADGLLVSAHGVYEVPARPEVLTHEVALSLPVNPGQMDRAFALDEPDHLRYRVLRRNRDHHVHMIRHQVPFFDLRLHLSRELVEHLAEIPAKLQIQRLPSTFRDEYDVVFAVHVVWLRL